MNTRQHLLGVRMYKVPAKFKRSISSELKKFSSVIRNLHAKGKSSSEDDARIVLNDMLADVLGYDKYNELKTEFREKNGRLDYAVQLTDGPNSKKRRKDYFDFVIEAKAAHINLSNQHVNQTLQYCLLKGIDFFILTNAVKWQLYFVKNTKKSPEAHLIHEVNFSVNNDIDALTEEFYLFHKNAYISGDWDNAKDIMNATKTEDVVAIMLSDKVTKLISKELANIHGVRVTSNQVKDVIENQVLKAEVEDVNNKLLKNLNAKPKKRRQKKETSETKGMIEIKAECSDSTVNIEVETEKDITIEDVA